MDCCGPTAAASTGCGSTFGLPWYKRPLRLLLNELAVEAIPPVTIPESTAAELIGLVNGMLCFCKLLTSLAATVNNLFVEPLGVYATLLPGLVQQYRSI
jgi:hypothetical protein